MYFFELKVKSQNNVLNVKYHIIRLTTVYFFSYFSQFHNRMITL